MPPLARGTCNERRDKKRAAKFSNESLNFARPGLARPNVSVSLPVRNRNESRWLPRGSKLRQAIYQCSLKSGRRSKVSRTAARSSYERGISGSKFIIGPARFIRSARDVSCEINHKERRVKGSAKRKRRQINLQSSARSFFHYSYWNLCVLLLFVPRFLFAFLLVDGEGQLNQQ